MFNSHPARSRQTIIPDAAESVVVEAAGASYRGDDGGAYLPLLSEDERNTNMYFPGMLTVN
jgi:hypothetical protein